MWGALLLLRQSTDPKAQTPLANLLRDEDPLVRFAAVQWVAEAKLEALRDAGIEIAESPADMGQALVRAIKRR